MNRKILFQVTGPAVVIGTLLLATCAVSAWFISRLQSDSDLLNKSLTSLEASQELEITARQLRYRTFLELMDPGPRRLEKIDEDHELFARWLNTAADAADTPEESRYLQEIRAAYQGYDQQLAELQANPPANIARFADAHPITSIVEPCGKLLEASKAQVRARAAETDRLSRQARLGMLLVGLAGPLGGLAIGYGAARGLSRSIYQLSVRVRSVAERLNQDVGSVDIAAEGDIQKLDAQLQHVLNRVEEVMERLQRQHLDMLRAEQLAAVGQLGASVAHEVRNPLMGIKLLIDAALRAGNGSTLTREDLQVIRGEIGRMEQTVQGLLDFARLPRAERTRFDLSEALGQAVELVRARARQQQVDIRLLGGGRPALVSMDRGQLHTVLVNLLLNGLDAMPSGGQLEITLDSSGDGQARILVCDTGSGIPPEIMGRLFTPFASHKPTGTGLGLSISRRIIEEHRGSISASNRPGGGACFRVTLPTCEA
jgi:two-component system, NtrC family, sensor histidine kinase HydH